MLVITRQADETVVITVPGLGSPIEVVVTGIRGDRVKLGISAPREVTIHRGEVQAQVDAERRVREGTVGLGASGGVTPWPQHRAQ